MPIRREVAVELDPRLEPREQIQWDFDVEPYLMGGGARPREHDRVAPVRLPAVLGQVRWFWRLLHHDLDLEKLRDQESRLFGGPVREDGVDVPSPAPFSPSVMSHPGKPAAIPKMTEPLGYLLFSGRETRTEASSHLSEGVRGTIRLTPPPPDDVLRAFKLWSLLGGVGARTRRGIGAVQMKGTTFTVTSLGETIKALLDGAAPVATTTTGMRGVHSVWVGEKTFRSAKDCLIALEDWYRKYRQHRRPGSPPRPGRSHWDEPEEIRKLVGSRARKHQPLPPTTEHPRGFARAALGLPIVFQFKDAKENDPAQTQLEGREYDRMASPLLFRPVRLTSNAYVPVVVRLSGPYEPPGGLELKGKGAKYAVSLTVDFDRVFYDLIAAARPLSLTNLYS